MSKSTFINKSILTARFWLSARYWITSIMQVFSNTRNYCNNCHRARIDKSLAMEEEGGGGYKNWSLATNSTLKYQRCPLLNYKDIQWEPEKWGIGRRLFDSSLTLNSTMIVRHCSCAVWTDLFPLLSDLIIF